ncbi:hypothetical protein [Rhodanobacter aciditrophus]|uniref:hypothetical protein n=1 Tax=Rhodanobacter aciditrophus TaxID=1623218 RepID=UPI003CFA871C
MSMSHKSSKNSVTGCLALVLRLTVGAPVLVGLLYLLGLVGWVVRGCPPDLAPGHWPFEVVVLPVLVASGLLAIAMLVMALGIFGCLALAVGDALIAAWQRLRR